MSCQQFDVTNRKFDAKGLKDSWSLVKEDQWFSVSYNKNLNTEIEAASLMSFHGTNNHMTNILKKLTWSIGQLPFTDLYLLHDDN